MKTKFVTKNHEIKITLRGTYTYVSKFIFYITNTLHMVHIRTCKGLYGFFN